MKTLRADKSSFSNSAGFTLVELIVAMSITIVLAGIMISVVAGILSAWNRSRGQLVASNQAKVVLDQLVTDLEGAFFKSDDGVWFATSILESNNSAASESNANLASDRNWVISGSQSVSIKPRTDADPRGFVLDAPSIADCRFGMAGVWLRFFTTKQDSYDTWRDASAPTAVSYQLVRRNVTSSSSSEIRYMLYRSEVRVVASSGGSPGTFETGYDLHPLGGSYTTPNDSEGHPGNLIDAPAVRVIANNVIDFGVRLYVREGSAFRLVFPAQAATNGSSPVVGTPSDSDSTVPEEELFHLAAGTFPDSADFYREAFPHIVEIHLRVLTDEGARLIQNLEAGRIAGNWWDIALANSRVFTRRVEILGRGL